MFPNVRYEDADWTKFEAELSIVGNSTVATLKYKGMESKGIGSQGLLD